MSRTPVPQPKKLQRRADRGPVADFTHSRRAGHLRNGAEPRLVAAEVDVANPAKLKKLAAFAKRAICPLRHWWSPEGASSSGIAPLRRRIPPPPPMASTNQTRQSPSPASPPNASPPIRRPRRAPAAARDSYPPLQCRACCRIFYKLGSALRLQATPACGAGPSRSSRISHEASQHCRSRCTGFRDHRGPCPDRPLFQPRRHPSQQLNGGAGPFAFLGQNSTSQVFYGYTFGGYYDFFHSGPLSAGFDMRESDLHANNAMLRSFLVGARVFAKPFTRPIKPYAQFSFGVGTTKPPASTVHVSKFDYALYGGVDYTLQKHIDFRAVEIGYGSVTTVSTGTVGGGDTQYIPASTRSASAPASSSASKATSSLAVPISGRLLPGAGEGESSFFLHFSSLVRPTFPNFASYDYPSAAPSPPRSGPKSFRYKNLLTLAFHFYMLIGALITPRKRNTDETANHSSCSFRCPRICCCPRSNWSLCHWRRPAVHPKGSGLHPNLSRAART